MNILNNHEILTLILSTAIGYAARAFVGELFHAKSNRKKIEQLVEQTQNQEEQLILLKQLVYNTSKKEELG